MFTLRGGRGDGGVVAGEDVLEEVGRGRGVDVVGSDDRVRVAVADDLQVDVVGFGAAGEHRVQLLSGLSPGGQAVHGVHGDALGAVDGGGVPELDGGGDVLRGQGQVVPGADVFDRQGPVAGDVLDGPAVAVLDPVVQGQAQPAVVGPGDDRVADVRGVPIREPRTNDTGAVTSSPVGLGPCGGFGRVG